MAEEVHAGVQGPNGERLQLTVGGGRSIAVIVKDLLPLLILALVGALGYYRIVTHDTRLATIDEHLQRLYAQQDSQRSDLQRSLLGQFEQQREQLRTQTELVNTEGQQVRAALRENREVTGKALHDQNELLARQTDHLSKNQDGLMEALRQQTERLRVWLATVLWKLEHPDHPVSLDVPLPHPERGR